MEKYQNGKIYKITNSENKEIYIGSTCHSLNCRMNGHRSDFKRGKTISSREILKYQDPLIVLIEDYPCNSKDELLKREQFYILNNDCVNKNIPARNDEQKKEYKSEIDKEYRKSNKESISIKSKNRYATNEEYKAKRKAASDVFRNNPENKETIIEQKKDWYEANKDRLIEQKKDWYKAHKEEIKAKNMAHYEANKEAINEKKMAYYEANKEAINEKKRLKRQEAKSNLI